jgi:ribosomal protein S27E
MAKIKYKCDDNGHEFIGNDFTADCPKCGSTIQPISGGSSGDVIAKIKEVIQTNKIVVGAVAALIVLATMFSKCGGSDSSGEQYTVEVNQPEQPRQPYLEVTIKAYKQEEGKSKSRTLDANEVLSVVDDKVVLGSGGNIAYIQDKNRIYLCPKDTGVVALIFKTKFGKKFKSTKNEEGIDEYPKTANFSLTGIMASDKAKCATQPLTSGEIEVKFLKGCKLQVEIKRNLKGKGVMVSLNGPDGDYQKKLTWDIKPLINTKQSIWVYFEGEDKSTATEAMGNGDMIPEGDCIPKDCSKVEATITKLATSFGNDPTNRSIQSSFQAFLNKTFTKQTIYLDNQQVDLSELQQKMSVNAKNNGSKYKLQGKIVLGDNCSSITFKFQEY